MYSILVVDDEPRQCRILSKVIQSYDETYDVHEAKNGYEAYKMIQTTHFDIVFCDIRMPIMDGLELIEKVRTSDLDTQFVILSGYGEFDYAQKAIGLHVADYLLKPIEEEQIYSTLDKVQHAISKRRARSQDLTKIEERLSLMRPIYIEHLMNQWLSNKDAAEVEGEIAAVLPSTRKGCILFLLSDNGKGGLSQEEILPEVIHSQMKGLGQVLFFRLQPSEGWITILGVDDDRISETTLQQILGILERITDSLRIRIWAGMSSLHDLTRKGLQKSLMEARVALDGRFYSQERSLFIYDDIKSLYSDSLAMYPNRDNYFFKYWIKDNGADERTAKKWVEGMTGGKWVRSDLLLNAIHAALWQYQHHLLKSMSLEEYIEKPPFTQLDEILRAKNVDAVYDFLCSHMHKINDFASSISKNRHIFAIEDCLSRLKSEFSPDLSLTVAASWYHLSPSYFSVLFKQYTGLSFIDYMSSVRVERALFLLKNTNKKVYEIAQEVGFQDVKYFTKVFRKFQKLSPEEFRQLGPYTKYSDN